MAELKTTDLKSFAAMLGVNVHLIEVKAKLTDRIKLECVKRKISQRQLAKMVPGLTHDRVSKIFSGQVGHMTVDKLIEILTCLNITTNVSLRPHKRAG